MKKEKFLQQKTRWRLKKQPGQVEWTYGLFGVLFLSIVICVQLQIIQYQSTNLYIEDALAASNLASALVDLEEYGRTHHIVISNPQRAYQKYCEAMKENLNLNHQWECQNKAAIWSGVEVVEYIIYNINTEYIEICRMDRQGRMEKQRGELGKVTAPNGVLVVATSVYSEVRYLVKGFLDLDVEGRKGKLVDIVEE